MGTTSRDGQGAEPARASWPLLGRDAELALMLADLDARRGVVLAGAAGVGKTRLLREVLRSASERGWATVFLVGSPAASTIPLGAFASFVDAWPDATASALAVTRRALLEHAACRPLALFVDDAHALDPASAVLLHQLGSSGDAVVFATVRAREMAPEPVTALWKDDVCDRIEILPISEREVGMLLEAVLDGETQATTAHALWEVSRGNVMLLREVVRDARSSGALARRFGLWAWERPPRFAPRLEDLLGVRLDGLDDDARRGLELLALGSPLPWVAFVRLVGADVAERLVTQDLVERPTGDPGGSAVLAHPLVGEVAAARVPPSRRREHLAALAEALADAEALGPDTMLRIVTWRREAGELLAPEQLLSAARTCLYSEPRLSESLARSALRGEGGFPAVDLLVQVLSVTHRADDAEAMLATVDPATLTVDDGTRLVLMRANNLTWGLARPDAAADLLEAEAARSTDEVQRARLRAHLAPVLLFAGRLPEAVELGERHFDDHTFPPAVRLDAALGLLPALAACGQPATALARAGEAMALVPECRVELPVAVAQIVSAVTLAQQWVGDLDACEAIMAPAFRDGVANDAPLQRGGAALRLAQVALWRGQPRVAVAHLREGIAALEVVDAGLLDWTVQTLRFASALLGDRAGLDDVDAIARTTRTYPLYDSERARADAAVAALDGDLRLARDVTRRALDACRDAGLLIPVVLLAWDLVRYDDAAAGAAVLAEVAPAVEGVLAELLAAAAVAACADDLDALERASERFEAAGYLLLAAETARLAARSATGRGLRARAVAAGARADLLVPPADGAVTPLLAMTGPDVGLTPREREVAGLAAEGWSDARIAARLGVSVRTVETHLHRVYAKCGVAGRRELSDIRWR